MIVWELMEGGLADLQYQLYQGPDRSPAADHGTGLAEYYGSLGQPDP